MTKKVAILGSTGSIGKNTIDVLDRFQEKFSVVALSALTKGDELDRLGRKYSAKTHLGPLTDESISFLIAEADFVVNAVPGFAGLSVSIATLKSGKTLLAANKESIAIAGKYLMEIAKENGGQIRPLDSEASAIWQLVSEHGVEKIKSITLTCSGGPFFGKKPDDLKRVSVQEAIDHPKWKMGPKVSLDSATLVNKVLEVYEVHNLFQIPLPDIFISIHRQSIVHGMIHTNTGATKMHITQNDMRLPISYALNFPVQPKCPWPIIRTRKSELSFESPDTLTFKPLAWLELHKGNPNFPIILNAMNDLATKLFLDGKISFLEIYDIIEKGLDTYIYTVPPKTLDETISFHKRITSEYEHSNIARVR